MPNISLTDLVDIVSKSGTPKATKVAQIKKRGEYAPSQDFYKPLRDHIALTHKSGCDRNSLIDLLSELTDGKKKSNYPSAIDGYRKWWGKRELSWFEPPRAVYSSSGIQVSVNPELGLILPNGQRLVVKLYLKDEKLNRHRIDLITALMESRLNKQANTTFGLLDVRESKFFQFGGDLNLITKIVDAELAYVATLWDTV